MNKAQVIEMVIFKTKPEVSEDGLVAKSKAVDAVLAKMRGFVGRTLSRGDKGDWLDIVYWTDLARAKAAATEVMSMPVCQEYFALIDEAQMRFEHLTIVARAP